MERGDKKRKGKHKMRKWKVYATSNIRYEVEVLANSAEDAMDKADRIDGAEWDEIDMTADWNPYRAEEVTE